MSRVFATCSNHHSAGEGYNAGNVQQVCEQGGTGCMAHGVKIVQSIKGWP